MKALNRAIARTVSQLSRHGAEGCHPPMLMALENHLDALLTMERKQLEVAGMKFATLTGDGTGEALPVISVTSTGCTDKDRAKRIAQYVVAELESTKAPDPAPKLSLAGMMAEVFAGVNTGAKPDAIDMTDPRNWQVGDVVKRGERPFPHFKPFEECTVTYSDDDAVKIVGSSGVEVIYSHCIGDPVTNFFTWLRHA